MKVTTDACILGAWTPIRENVYRVLDIGAGTGLLALMLAQRAATIMVDAVEYDATAAQQAQENAAASPWQSRVSIIHSDVKELPAGHKYDLIITNPPFFNNSLLGDNTAKNRARHTTTLSYEDLLNAIEAHIQPDGSVAILLPTPEYFVWKELATQRGWHEEHKLAIKHTRDAPAKRIISMMTKRSVSETTGEELVIYESKDNYSADFGKLLAPFYLNL